MSDTELTPLSEEQRRQKAEEEEFARRVRREVRRIESGEADLEMEREREEEQVLRQIQQAELEREKRRAASPFRGFFTGGILRQEWFAGNYRYPLIIAAVFLVSIAVMFWSLTLDMTLSQTERDVRLLRERAVRVAEERNRHTSHSAIVQKLKERGIELHDPEEPNIVVKQKR